ncbi:MAG: hypothetical protein ACI3XH_01380 [Phascolarctobacterium sp.]
MTITIARFTLNDIAEATRLTLLTWGEEMALANPQLKEVLYEAMVRYYFRSSDFSYKMADEAGAMQGFLLATPLTSRDSSQKWLQEQLQGFAADEQDLVYNYLRYLSYNGQQVRKLAQTEDLLLCLFLSRKPGVGSKLLENVEEVAHAHSIKRMHLWADATCDYSYYRRRGYKETGHFINKILPELGNQATWIYSKEVRP